MLLLAGRRCKRAFDIQVSQVYGNLLSRDLDRVTPAEKHQAGEALLQSRDNLTFQESTAAASVYASLKQCEQNARRIACIASALF